MAAQIVTRRAAAVSALLGKSRLSPLRPIAAVRLLRSSSQQPQDPSDERALDVDRRPNEPSAVAVRRPRRRGGGDIIPSFFDAFDPFNPGRSVGQLLSFMDQMMENPFAGGGGGGGLRPGWSAREDEEALYIRVEMPGLGKEDVRVTVEQNAVVIKGEKGAGEEESEEEEGGGRRRYSGRIELPASSYRLDAIKAEMRDGLLKVVVPKVKEEERKDVVQVPVE